MLFSYNFLQSFFEEKLPAPEKLGDLLLMHFFEVEGVEKVDGDYALDIDILSSRAGDCLSHIGIAREISVITGMSYKIPERKIKESKESLDDRVIVKVKDACNRYSLRGVEKVKVGPSPSNIQKILKTCGINPINNVVDITNYVMLETGQPLHAFDADKLQGDIIFVRKAKKREKIVTLDEKRYDLMDNILLIADEQYPIGIAGIKGGAVPEVDEDTNTIYIEAANFDPVTIRRGSRNIKLRTDASLRFEHGLPLELTMLALDRAVSMMAEIAGGSVMKDAVDWQKEERVMREIELDAEKLRKILGKDIPLKEIERILRGLEFDFKRSNSVFYVHPPYFREDVTIVEDVYEEIGRIYGYDQIEPVFPEQRMNPETKKDFLEEEMIIKREWKEMLFTEIYTHSFINEEEADYFSKRNLIEVEKPVSLEFKYLRPTLFCGLLRSVQENQKNFDEVRLFEMGKVFVKEEEEKDEQTVERKVLAVASSADDFYSLKGKIDSFLQNHLGEGVEYHEGEGGFPFEKGLSAQIYCGKQRLGSLGVVEKKVVKKMKLEGTVVVAEIEVDELQQQEFSGRKYNRIYKVPPFIRDISVLVPKRILYREVMQVVEKAGGKTLREIELFDYYEGERIPQDKKSFALRLYFQLEDKTLAAEQVNKLQDKIIKSLDDKKDWKVRK